MALPAFAAAMRYLRRLFAEHRLHPSDDLLTALVQAEEPSTDIAGLWRRPVTWL
ncbi:MAG TPA: hypothetical protein PKE45_26345 [Caldilineaceae bacterium]|nr:hypothetical protein [Caldilineaceae bacterium]